MNYRTAKLFYMNYSAWAEYERNGRCGGIRSLHYGRDDKHGRCYGILRKAKDVIEMRTQDDKLAMTFLPEIVNNVFNQ